MEKKTFFGNGTFRKMEKIPFSAVISGFVYYSYAWYAWIYMIYISLRMIMFMKAHKCFGLFKNFYLPLFNVEFFTHY